MTGGWASRAARAAVFTAAAVLLAAFGHHMMSAAAVPGWALALAVPVIGTAAWALTGRERGALVVIPATLAAQSALHYGFTYAQRVETVAAQGGPGSAHAGHGMGSAHAHAHVHAHAHTPAHATAHPTADAATGSVDPTGMLAAHVLIALLCALWLARGEHAAFRMQRLLRTVRAFARGLVPSARRHASPVPPDRHRPRVCPSRRAYALPAPRRLLLVRSLAFRGPPVA